MAQKLAPSPEEAHANFNQMHGAVPPKVIEKLECKHHLVQLDFSTDAAHNYGYDSAKKYKILSPLKLTS